MKDCRQRRGFGKRERLDGRRNRKRQLRSLELKVGAGRAATRSVAMGSCLPCRRELVWGNDGRVQARRR